jgi:hypothetical protein
MNRDQDLVAIAMNSYRIVEVLILIVRRELDIDVFTDTGGDHPLLIIFNLKIWGRRRQDVKSLRGGRVVNQPHLQSVRLQCLEPCKFHHRWVRTEYAVRADIIIHVLFEQYVGLVSLGLRE